MAAYLIPEFFWLVVLGIPAGIVAGTWSVSRLVDRFLEGSAMLTMFARGCTVVRRVLGHRVGSWR